jgi:hypothetical protein
MSNFKVDDVVRCVRGSAIIGVSEDKAYTVLDVDKDGDIAVINDTGQHMWVLENRFVMHTPAQALAIAGGLQPHSVGDLYPLAVVTYDNGDDTTIFVENLQEGSVATQKEGQSYPRKFDSHEQALAAIEAGELLFSKGRPHYVPSADVWVLYNEPNPVRVVRLHNMLHRN